MDLYKTIDLTIQSKIGNESFQFRDPQRVKLTRQQLQKIIRMSMYLSIFIGILSIYLSWTRNTSLGVSTGWKIFYAFFAGMFGTLYLFFYFLRSLIEQDIFKHLKKTEIV